MLPSFVSHFSDLDIMLKHIGSMKLLEEVDCQVRSIDLPSNKPSMKSCSVAKPSEYRHGPGSLNLHP